jgi:hypothetical protein
MLFELFSISTLRKQRKDIQYLAIPTTMRERRDRLRRCKLSWSADYADYTDFFDFYFF